MTTRHRHRSATPWSSRVLATALVTTAALAALAGLAGPAAAQTESADLRAEAERVSARYFATLATFARADAAMRDNEAQVAELQQRAAQARAAARTRALLAYKSAGGGLSAVIAGDTTAEAARRVKLVDAVNARDNDAYRKLRALARQLRTQQQALRDSRQAQEAALADLKAQGAALDTKLAAAQQREQAAAAALAAQQAAAAATTTAPTTTTVPRAPAPPPNYTGTPGTHPHHDDPFLACVRARESSGNYGAVNPAGPYLGAYQFLQATWNGAAAHAGRSDLVGVPANAASPYDQDDVAWALYQWQGSGPWGGACG